MQNTSVEIFNGRYSITQCGKVYSNITNKQLRTKITPRGYESVGLYIEPSVYKWFFIHRLVALAFIGEREYKQQVNHIDGDKLNNHYANLEYVTQSENALHAYRLGLQIGRKGEKHHKAKLTDKLVVEILSYLKQGCRAIHIAKFLNISQQLVCDLKAGRRWKHLTNVMS